MTAAVRALTIVAAGVGITTAATTAGAQWSLSAAPILQIGSDESPDYEFNRIVHLLRLSDNRILVTTGPDIRFFGPDGRFLSRAGGRGRGPGEYQFVSSVVPMPGDTLYTMNIRSIVVLDREGKYLRQSMPDLSPLAADGWFGEGHQLLPNGNLLVPQYSQEDGAAPSPSLARPRLRYVILDLASGRVIPLHQSGGLAQQYVNGEPLVMPFSPHARHAVGRDRVYVGDNDSTRIHAFDLTGRPVGSFTVAAQVTPMAREDLEAYRQLMLEFARRRNVDPAEMDRRWDATPKPRRHPYWGTALVDETGVLWVSAPDRMNNAPLNWTAFGRDGRRLATLAMPARFTPKQIGADFVLGVQRDEDDVESIAMYGLRRGR